MFLQVLINGGLLTGSVKLLARPTKLLQRAERELNKLLVITGASRGIGLATAKHFLEQNYRVINLSRTACTVEGVSNIEVDLLDEDWPKQCAAPLLREIGDPEQLVLIHSAGLLTKDRVDDVDIDVLRQVMQLNVIAPAQLNKLLIPKMTEGSSVLYVGSTLGTKAVANSHAYVTSKHAVVGQMRATCQDLAGTKIHTACVCPGFTETEMLTEHLSQNPEILKSITSMIAHERLVQPSEIAETLWFCSQSPVINGSLIHANLGQIER